MEPFKPEYENLYRGLPGGVELRDGGAEGEDGGGADSAAADTTLVGHFAQFGAWYQIESWYEGEFIERVQRGAFTKTIRENGPQIKVQYDHGEDEFIGSAPLGPIDVLREEDFGPYYEVPLLDTDYNRDRVLPQLQGRLMSGEKRGSVLGASMRFRVVKDSWVMEPKPSTYNPRALPERTITEARLYEFGPVVFPASPTATAMAGVGMRSLTDHYLERRRSKRSATHQFDQSAAPVALTDPTPSEPPSALGGQQQATPPPARSRALLALAFADLTPKGSIT